MARSLVINWEDEMNIFVVNLKKSVEKRQKLEAQFQKLGIHNYEFIEAVYGADLSEEDLATKVYDYENCALTPGEIGCSLSHIYIYQEMVDRNIPYALVIEDDVTLPEDLIEFLNHAKDTIDVPYSKLITLGEANKISLLREHSQYKDYREYTAVTAFCTYAYLVNLEAAKSLSQQLLPVKYEADMLIHFRENGWLKQFNVFYPQYIHPMEGFSEMSDLKDIRRPFKRQRHEYKKKFLKQRPLGIRIKNRMMRAIWKIRQIKPKK